MPSTYRCAVSVPLMTTKGVRLQKKWHPEHNSLLRACVACNSERRIGTLPWPSPDTSSMVVRSQEHTHNPIVSQDSYFVESGFEPVTILSSQNTVVPKKRSHYQGYPEEKFRDTTISSIVNILLFELSRLGDVIGLSLAFKTVCTPSHDKTSPVSASMSSERVVLPRVISKSVEVEVKVLMREVG
ncbi:hypothetical protein TNCV_2617491 [Trichonephila clavipes]|nr:hypothetical protein TNCV_2617491 [Trichonephila clavipes]